MAKATDEIIDVSEIVVAPRGRKAVVDTELAAKFADLPVDKAVRLTTKFGSVEKGAPRQKVSGTIRKAWEASGRTEKVRINFGVDGVPTVSAKVEA